MFRYKINFTRSFAAAALLVLLASCAQQGTSVSSDFVDESFPLEYERICNSELNLADFIKIDYPRRNEFGVMNFLHDFYISYGGKEMVITGLGSCFGVVRSSKEAIQAIRPPIDLYAETAGPFYSVLQERVVRETTDCTAASSLTKAVNPDGTQVEPIHKCWPVLLSKMSQLELSVPGATSYVFVISDDVYLWGEEEMR